MKNQKALTTYMLILSFVILGFAGPSISYASNPGVWVTNHVMARDVYYSNGFYQTSDIYAYFYGDLGLTWSFKALDDFTCEKGYYTVDIRIVSDSNEIVASLESPITINANINGFIHSSRTNWSVKLPHYGWYDYQIWANGELVKSYSFYLRSSKI